jgi:hypothetical protein
MLYDIQTVVELFPGIRDHYAMPIGFLTAEEKRVARAQIPKWDALLPNLREQLVVANANANDAPIGFVGLKGFNSISGLDLDFACTKQVKNRVQDIVSELVQLADDDKLIAITPDPNGPTSCWG